MSETTLTSTTLSVPDISCAHCARTIEAALAPIAGVQSVVVDIPARHVRISYQPDVVAADQINAILREEGYPVASTVDGLGSASR